MKLAVFVALSLTIGFVLGVVVRPGSVKAQGRYTLHIDEVTRSIVGGMSVMPGGINGVMVGFSCVSEEDGPHCFVASR